MSGVALIIYKPYSEVLLSSKTPKEASRVQYAMFSKVDDPVFSSFRRSHWEQLWSWTILCFYSLKGSFKPSEQNKLAYLRVPELDQKHINVFFS